MWESRWVSWGLAALAALGSSSCSLLVPEGSGAPLGASRRAGDSIATLLQTLESRVPELHRRPENDRYRLSLVLHPLDGGAPKVVVIARGLRASDYIHAARIIADDGRLLWFHAHENAAYDYRAGRLLMGRDLPPGGPLGPMSMSRITPPKEWQEATERFGTQYKRPALLRETPSGKVLRLEGPDGYLLTYRSTRGLYGTMVLARVTEDGKVLWTVDTDLQDVEQILPGWDTTSVIGKRLPKVPDEVRGPTLVKVNMETGATHSHSLWL
jgi:hypothetical protein